MLTVAAGLALGAEASRAQPPPQTISAGVYNNWIGLNGWTPGTTVTVVIDGASHMVPIDGAGNGWMNTPSSIVPGTTITATYGLIEKTLVVESLRITSLNFATDSVGGIATPGAAVHLQIQQDPDPQALASADVTALGGTWGHSFAPFDITLGMKATATITDADGDHTYAEQRTPTVSASIDFDHVTLSNWIPGSAVTVNIGGVVRSVSVDSAGNANIFRQPHGQDATHGQDIVPGMAISATDGTITKTLSVVPVHIDSVDLVANTVHGTAPPNAQVHLNVNPIFGGGPLGFADATADGAGNWTAVFAVDLDYGVQVWAAVADGDGDLSQAGKNVQQATISASLTWDNVNANGFEPGQPVTFTIRSGADVLASGTRTTDGMGNAWFNRYQDHQVDLVPGLQVTAVQGGTTKGLTLEPLRITSVNPVTEVVSGTASDEALIQVRVNEPTGDSHTMTAAHGAGGTWSADFSGVHNVTTGTTANASIADLDGDTTSFDKPPATIGASLTFDSVNANGFAPSADLTLVILPGPGEDPLDTVTKRTDANGSTSFNRFQDHAVDLAHSMYLTASDGTITKTLTLHALTIDSIDAAGNRVSGTAPSGANVQVNVMNPAGGGGMQRQVVANASGDWTADFNPFDVKPGAGANASVRDSDLDSTSYDRPSSTITASITYDMVSANNFTPGGQVTFAIFESAEPGATLLDYGAKTADPSGNATFSRWGGDHAVDLVPGLYVTASDEVTEKTLTLASLTIVSINPGADVVSGTAPPSAWVNVGVFDATGGPPGPGTQVQAAANGSWSASFAGVYDVTATTGARAFVPDADGDQTGVDKRPATIEASISDDNVSGNGFVPSTDVTLEIRSAPGVDPPIETSSKTTDPNGNTWFNRWDDYQSDLRAGMEVTVTDGTETKVLELVPLAITSVDPAGDVVSGTAPGGAQVWVDVDDPSGFGSNAITAAGDGRWSIDFTGTFDFGFEAHATARVAEPDGDNTTFSQSPPRIDSSLTWDDVSVQGFAPGSDVTLTIDATEVATKQADSAGRTDFERWQDYEVDLVPGTEITVADGTNTKELTLANLVISSVDPVTDIVSGLAPPNAQVHVWVSDPIGGNAGLTVQAAGSGLWSADFTGLVGITPSTGAHASVSDEDGDTTGFENLPATIDASLTWDVVNADGFEPGAGLTLTIDGTIVATKAADSTGRAEFYRWDDYDVDLVPGTEIAVSDGTSTKELTVAALAIASVDYESDVVFGNAPGDAAVSVYVNGPSGENERQVVAEDDGSWAAAFESFDITYATSVDASVTDSDGDRTNVSKPPTRIDASLTWDGISVEGFAASRSVTLTIDGVEVKTKQTDGAGNAWFARWDDFDADLVPGVQIAVEDDQGNAKELTLAALTVDSVDPASDTVTGTAVTGENVEVQIWSESGEAYQETTATSGGWSIDFSPFDVTYGTWADARVRDADGDATAATRQPPRISADAAGDVVSGEWFGAGEDVTLRIEGSIVSTKTADEGGNVWFERGPDFNVDLTVGTDVSVSDGTQTKELTLAALTIDAVDAEADTISGTAPPNTVVHLPGPEGELASPTSDANGAWSVDLHGDYDIAPGEGFQAQVFDDEWDATSAWRQAPTITANLTLDTVGGCGFAANDSVTLTVGSFSGPLATDAGGCFEANRSGHGKDLVAGMTVSVTDGGITRTLTLATLTMEVDVTTGHIQGTAPPGATVEVGYGVVDEQRGDGRRVTANGSGHWVADFGGAFGPNVEIRAGIADSEGDRTEVAWFADLFFDPGVFTVPENAGTVQITVRRFGLAHAEVGVSYATSDGTATGGADYTATSGTLAFPDGTATRTFTVAITDDASDEPNESVNLTLSDPSGGGALGDPFTSTITIIDDDTPDTDPPETTIDSGSSGPTNDSTPTFTFSADEPGSTFECRIDSQAFAPCTSPYTTVALAEGTHIFEVKATDLAGNSDPTPASRSFTIDTLPPVVSIDSGPLGLTNDSTPTFTFSAGEPSSFECRVDSGAFTACTSPYTTNLLADGPHVFEVQATDEAGNRSTSPPRPITVDTVAPQTAIDTGPSGPTGDPTPTFTFSSEPGATFRCRVDPGAFTACTSPYTSGALSDGPHVFEVEATDAAGNTDPSPASRSFTVDTVVPQTTIETGPGGPTNDPTPTFGFSANETATFQCRVDAVSYASCTSPYTTDPLADGAHTFQVRATDPAGNLSAATSRSFTVDTVPPQTAIDSGPSGITPDTTPTFEFSSDDGVASFQCRVDAAPYATCTSPYTTDPLGDGAHSFQVRATDAAGNVDASPATRSFTVDTGPPQTTIDSGPSGLTNDSTPTFSFSAGEPSTFQCRVDAGAFAACSSPHTIAAVGDGGHSFEVRAIDAAANIDPTPAIRTFTVDTAPPETTIDSGPSGATNVSMPTFTFSSEPGASFQCRIDAGAFAPCSSPHTTPALADGAHSFEVRAIDAAGNADGTPAGRSFTVDTTPPETTIVSGPSGATTDATPTFEFTSEPGATFQSRVDGAGFAASSSPYTTSTLALGAHSFEVRATDAAGNVDPTPAARAFTVAAPVVRTTLGIASTTVKVSKIRVAPVKLRCGGQARCSGTVTLKFKKTTLGTRAFSIPAGRTATVNVKLTGKAYKLLVRSKRLRAQALVSFRQPDGSTARATRTLTLVAPKPAAKR